MRKILLALFPLCFPFILLAQDLEVGGGFGISFYQGDVSSSQSLSFTEPNLGFSIYLKKQLSTKWGIRLQALMTNLEGNDLNYPDPRGWRQQRAYSFETAMQAISLRGEWDFINTEEDVKSFHPYVALGLGVVLSNTQSIFPATTEHPDGTMDIKETSISMPISIGFTFDLPNQLAIGLEATNGFVFSDLLDGLQPDGSNSNDSYNFIGVTLGYVFGDGRTKGLGRNRFGKKW